MSMGRGEAAEFQRLKELVEALLARVEALEAKRKK
jgi:hypothetical protein